MGQQRRVAASNEPRQDNLAGGEQRHTHQPPPCSRRIDKCARLFERKCTSDRGHHQESDGRNGCSQSACSSGVANHPQPKRHTRPSPRGAPSNRQRRGGYRHHHKAGSHERESYRPALDTCRGVLLPTLDAGASASPQTGSDTAPFAGALREPFHESARLHDEPANDVQRPDQECWEMTR